MAAHQSQSNERPISLGTPLRLHDGSLPCPFRLMSLNRGPDQEKAENEALQSLCHRKAHGDPAG
ncbi:hypothetical protein N7481_010495 [Penicillium waksmanii]|uniref:uncharacterized protein n=1 Tax=Penicillium waksmanii TaxID=69791 RepID=UPI002547737F|nr:uncharacterized protein N7481_010495 [Penicillium waksmanii]KAJ5973285.1 hypothetical protein N7481_010495 [Penicillium waksmanii]